MVKINRNIWLILAATIFYIINRASTDIPSHSPYWERKSVGFLIGDFISNIILAYVIDFLTNKYIKICESNKRSLFSEYAILIILSEIFCCIVVFCRGMLLHGKMYSIEQVIVGLMIAPFFFCLFYAFKKHIRENEKQRLLLIQQNELKHEKLQTELQALRAQYHPHFLFNALNTIYFLIDPKNKKAREAIEILSEILRYQVKCGGEKVSLQNEIEYIRKDIEIRKLRSSKQLFLNMDIGDNEKDEYIYPLLFTPIIENAFKYVGGDYKINISLHKDNHSVIFKVINSLPDDYDLKEKTKGTGLSNLRRRLDILYPNKNRLNCSQENNDYTAILKVDLL